MRVSDEKQIRRNHEIFRLYCQGYTIRQLAELFHLSRPMVYKIVRRQQENGPDPLVAVSSYTLRDEEMYARWQAGESQKALAASYGISPVAVHYAIRRYIDRQNKLAREVS